MVILKINYGYECFFQINLIPLVGCINLIWRQNKSLDYGIKENFCKSKSKSIKFIMYTDCDVSCTCR